MKAWISEIFSDFPDDEGSPEKTVVFKVSGKEFRAFYLGPVTASGEERMISLSLLDAATVNSSESAFSGNSNKRLDLVPDQFWSYHGFGKIVSADPTRCDFGSIQLDIGLDANKGDIGKFVYWYIDRLEIDFP